MPVTTLSRISKITAQIISLCPELLFLLIPSRRFEEDANSSFFSCPTSLIRGNWRTPSGEDYR